MHAENIVEFNGAYYAKAPGKKYYFKITTKNEDRRNAKQLHVAVWEYHNGMEVPAGHHIHHKDLDPDNNTIDNLECMEQKAHLRLHAGINARNPEYVARRKVAIAKAGEAAKAWHSSPEGLEWHRQHAATSIHKRNFNYGEGTCPQCGKSFTKRNVRQTHCSCLCANRTRSGYGKLHPVLCPGCGETFLTKRPTYQKYCTTACKESFYKKEREVAKELLKASRAHNNG